MELSKKVTLNKLAEFYLDNSTIYKPHKNADDTLTVVITNWRRLQLLEKCVMSVVRNRIYNIVITCAEYSKELIKLLEKITNKYPYIKVNVSPFDCGNNWTWLNGVYSVKTPFVLILHDDDILSPKFGETYRNEIKPLLDSGEIGHVNWDGLTYDLNKNELTRYHINNCSGTGINETHKYDPRSFYDFYKDPMRAVYPISPVVQIFDSNIAKMALKECEYNFTRNVFFWPRKTMMLGNDVMLGLRNLQNTILKKKKALYVNKPLTYYGTWDESVSQIAVNRGDSKFVDGYMATRWYYNNNENLLFDKPMNIHTVSMYKPKDKNDLRRHKFALTTWLNEYDKKQMFFCPLYDSELKRTSKNVGDKISVPFIRDIFKNGVKYALSDDNIVMSNSDICFVEDIINISKNNVEKNGCTFSYRRDILKQNVVYLTRKQVNKDTAKYMGMDFVMFNVKWWNNWGDKIFPDLLIGKPTWDLIFRFVLEYSKNKTNALKINPLTLGNTLETPNLIYHEKHASYAERPEIYGSDPANIYCYTTTIKFLSNYYTSEEIVEKYLPLFMEPAHHVVIKTLKLIDEGKI